MIRCKGCGKPLSVGNAVPGDIIACPDCSPTQEQGGWMTRAQYQSHIDTQAREKMLDKVHRNNKIYCHLCGGYYLPHSH